MNRMHKKLLVASALVLGAALVAQPDGNAQQGPGQLTVGIYAPSVAFDNAAARAAYVQGLAKAIQARTNIPTTGKAFAKLSDLKAAKPDFAIIDGLCVATSSPDPVLATASIGGSTSQSWALFTRGDSFGALKGKKLAYLETGCRDFEFMDNALLNSEAKVKVHFSSQLGRLDSIGAVATVKDAKQADAVFAPAAMGKGLSKAFDAGSVPNPGFVQMNKGLPANVVQNTQAAVTSYGAMSGIDGWKAAASYAGLSADLAPKIKRLVFAMPEVVRLDDQDVIKVPTSKFEQTKVVHLFRDPRKP